ncbi:hypothetical protein O3P69_001175 [Scylla paramamosain]|uniref:Uncharacterized protein n=1 Tax=Scylla paramamosain TaxID=85552 RepID=A0AAW0UP16_SCYPA
MIMDGIDPMSAAAMAESSAMSFSLVSFDTFDKGGDCLPSGSVFDRPVEDLNTPVTTSEMPTFFQEVETLEEPDPPPITDQFEDPHKTDSSLPSCPPPTPPSLPCSVTAHQYSSEVLARRVAVPVFGLARGSWQVSNPPVRRIVTSLSTSEPPATPLVFTFPRPDPKEALLGVTRREGKHFVLALAAGDGGGLVGVGGGAWQGTEVARAGGSHGGGSDVMHFAAPLCPGEQHQGGRGAPSVRGRERRRLLLFQRQEGVGEF